MLSEYFFHPVLSGTRGVDKGRCPPSHDESETTEIADGNPHPRLDVQHTAMEIVQGEWQPD